MVRHFRPGPVQTGLGRKICGYSKHATHIDNHHMESGEPVGIRTRDLLIKSQLLYQLSYRPHEARD